MRRSAEFTFPEIDLIGDKRRITQEDLHGFSGPALTWAEEAFRRKTIDTVLETLFLSAQTRDYAGAIAYLNTCINQEFTDPVALTWSDIKRGTILKTNSLRGLDKEGENTTKHRQFGIKSHTVISHLLQNIWHSPHYDEYQQPEQQLVLGEEFQIAPALSEETYNPDDIDEKYCEELRDLLIKIQTNYSNTSALDRRNIRQLEHQLSRIFGKNIDELRDKANDAGTSLYFDYTLMEWASSFLWTQEIAPWTVLTEVNVLGKNFGFNGGRVDILKVKSIDGEEPDSRQLKSIKNVSGLKNRSVGQAAQRLRSELGDGVKFEIVDLKFAIGDGSDKRQIIDFSSISENPLKAHEKQVKGYIALSDLNCYLMGFGKGLWENDFFSDGTILYFHPLSPKPIEYHITMSPDEKRLYFRDEVIAKKRKASKAAVARTADQLVYNFVSNPDRVQKGNSGNQAILPWTDVVIENGRNYLDPWKIAKFETIDRFGREYFLFDFNSLVQAVADGKIGSFSPESLGERDTSITCVNPDHDDSTPSMRIYTNGTVICYGCGTRGWIDSNTIPDEMPNFKDAVMVSRSRNGILRNPEFDVPYEHHTLMKAFNETLAKFYPGSLAEKYIVGDRKLDSDFMRAMGVGYGDRRVITDMLKQGVTLEELFMFGILKPSERVKQSSPLVSDLTSIGIPIAELYRKAGKNPDKSDKLGLPYFGMEGRVTAPLLKPEEIGDNLYTNVYGRAIWEGVTKRGRHRKLPLTHGVPHGVFNPEPFTNGYNEIIVTEGVMDAASLAMLGLPNTSALIGLNSLPIMTLLAKSGRDVALAFDNDDEGKKKTSDTIKLLIELGVKNIRDFTDEFVKENPDAQGFDDYNSYWQYICSD